MSGTRASHRALSSPTIRLFNPKIPKSCLQNTESWRKLAVLMGYQETITVEAYLRVLCFLSFPGAGRVLPWNLWSGRKVGAVLGEGGFAEVSSMDVGKGGWWGKTTTRANIANIMRPNQSWRGSIPWQLQDLAGQGEGGSPGLSDLTTGWFQCLSKTLKQEQLQIADASILYVQPRTVVTAVFWNHNIYNGETPLRPRLSRVTATMLNTMRMPEKYILLRRIGDHSLTHSLTAPVLSLILSFTLSLILSLTL